MIGNKAPKKKSAEQAVLPNRTSLNTLSPHFLD